MTHSTPKSICGENTDASSSLVKVLALGIARDKAQQRFRQLVSKIERKRGQLKEWKAYELRFNQRIVGELEPARVELRAGQRQMVLLIDELLSAEPSRERRLGKTQRAKLRGILNNLVGGLLSEDGEGDEVLEALHAKYQGRAGEKDRLFEMELAESLVKDVLGLKVGDDHGASSVEEFLQHAQRKMQEQVEEEARRAEEKRQRRRDRRSKADGAGAGGSAQAQRDQAAKELSQSLRDVFRKLVSALHPDREPDPEERERKNALMQRVNQAYDANDLLTLLELQLHIEQIDAEHLASVPPQRLAHYNQILSDQVTELNTELNRTIHSFIFAVDLPWHETPTIADIDRALSAQVTALRNTVRELQEELAAFRDPEKLRESLRHFELEDEGPAFDDLNALADLANFAGYAEHMERSPRRSRRGKPRRGRR